MPFDLKELSRAEKTILDSKRELSQISESRWKALMASDERTALHARMEATEKTLNGCKIIARYLGNFSAPIAREIETREKEIRREFDNIRQTKDPWELQVWIKTRLTPFVKSSERLAHVAASSVMKMRGLDVAFHRWTSNTKGATRS